MVALATGNTAFQNVLEVQRAMIEIQTRFAFSAHIFVDLWWHHFMNTGNVHVELFYSRNCIVRLVQWSVE